MSKEWKTRLKIGVIIILIVAMGCVLYLFYIDRKGEKVKEESDKNTPNDRWPNFKFSEFDSPAIASQVLDANLDTYQRGTRFYLAGTGEQNMDHAFLDMLQDARTRAAVPFKINSGYRTQVYNDSLRDSVPDSAHIKGHAADIATTSENQFQIAQALANAGFRRLGFARNYIHADNDPDKIATTWNYRGATKYTIDQLLT